MKKKKNGGKMTRVTLDLSPEDYERVEKLQDRLSGMGKANVLRMAAKLLSWYVGATLDGQRVYIRYSDGKEEQSDLLRILFEKR